MPDSTSRPWLRLYSPARPASLVQEHRTMTELFEATAAAAPWRTALHYFDGALTYSELNERSDSLAVALAERGFAPGDALALYTQNDPAFVVGLLAAWKAGGKAVMVNPMNKARELAHLLTDSGATALLCLDTLYTEVAHAVLPGTSVTTTVAYSALDGQTRDDPRLFDGMERAIPDGTLDLEQVFTTYRGKKPAPALPDGDDVAVLSYTSGTTGAPKGAMNTHASMAFNCQTYREWTALTETDRILGLAPLFHITGLIGHVGAALLTGCPLILAHRFEPSVMLDAIREHHPTFTVGAITAFIALTSRPDVSKDDFASFRIVYSGGAPIAPAVHDRILDDTGVDIHNIYGLTETNSPTHAVPMGRRAPVDPATGSLSVGVPVFDTLSRIVDDEGEEVRPGTIGEIVTSGPQVVPGYWNDPVPFPGGELRTGDVGFMDHEGWFYVVDRKKDMINASGYKVWPREVEDVLLAHPDVQEAAVIGVPDDYRGETVKAFVVLRPGASATQEDLIEHCRTQMAAYKYPRSIEFLDTLPKTISGKTLRRALRPPG
ncbi:class I adenylate-forming enzyme family protein [Actinomadura sp. 9N407]|uniref:class I adenylate-forming enzyme family protein n=1 Tax=Actinomadura sp. 9N407 TaxID=3375154 RepID=UPI0037B2BFF4